MTHPITDSKRRIVSDVMAPVDFQGHLVSGPSGSKTQSCKYLLNAGKSCSTPWVQQWQSDLRESFLTCGQHPAYAASVGQEAGCQVGHGRGDMPGANAAETPVAAITPMYSVQFLSAPECPHQLPSAAVQLRSRAGICLKWCSVQH